MFQKYLLIIFILFFSCKKPTVNFYEDKFRSECTDNSVAFYIHQTFGCEKVIGNISEDGNVSSLLCYDNIDDEVVNVYLKIPIDMFFNMEKYDLKKGIDYKEAYCINFENQFVYILSEVDNTK